MFVFIDEQVKRDMLYVRSCLHEIYKLARLFKFKQKSYANHQRLVEVEFLLQNILCFLYGVEHSTDFDVKNVSKGRQPIPARQKIIRDLNLLEILIDIIHYPFKNELYQISKVHKSIYVA